MDQPHLITDVLVVGAGPTGLMLANWLRKLGVDVVLVDAKHEPTWESRAIGIQSRTMEIYDQLGVVGRVLEQAKPALTVRPGYGRRSFAAVPLGMLGQTLTPYPGLHFLEQSKNEQILLAHLEQLGGHALWDWALTALEDAEDGVTATFGGPGKRKVTARYCVGCDGGSSTVRTIRGIPFEGVTNQQTFYVIDALNTTGLSHASVNVRLGASDFLLAFPLKAAADRDDTHRLIGAVPQGSDTLLSESAVRTRLASVFGVSYGRSRWYSTYRVHHRVAARFRDGRVFLAGDAGHMHSPVGAQGMNTGLQDAHNLAFKLADVLVGRAGEGLLDRYEAERQPVARRLVNTTDRLFGALTSSRLPARAARRVLPTLAAPLLARILPRLPIAPRLAGYLAQIRIHYWMSDEAKHAAWGRRGRIVGRRLPWTGSNYAVLSDAAWQVHTYGGVDAEVSGAVGRSLALPVHRFPAAPSQALREGYFYLVRPDGFVAAEISALGAVAGLRAALPPAAPKLPRRHE